MNKSTGSNFDKPGSQHVRRSQRLSVHDSQNSNGFNWDRYYINARGKLVEKRKRKITEKKLCIKKNVNLQLSSYADNILNSKKCQTLPHPDATTLKEQTGSANQLSDRLIGVTDSTAGIITTISKKTKNQKQNRTVNSKRNNISKNNNRKNGNKENSKPKKKSQELKCKRGRISKTRARDIQNNYIETLIKASSQPARYHENSNSNPNASNCLWMQRHDILPRVYPPHFLHQRRLSDGEPTNDSRTNNTSTHSFYANLKEFEDNVTDLPMTKDHNATSGSTISLSESLCDVFEVNDIRDLLQVQAPVFRLYEHHVQMLALTLNVDLQYMQSLLENISKLTAETIRKTLVYLQRPHALLHQLTRPTPLTFDLKTPLFLHNGRATGDEVSESECSPSTKHIRHFSSQKQIK